MAGQHSALDSRELTELIADGSLTRAAELLCADSPGRLVDTLGELGSTQQAVAFRLLPKDLAIDVFERLDAGLQKSLVRALHDEEVTEVFAALDPDDRARLVEELPAKVAKRLIADLSPHERARTAVVLGYPADSVGRFVHEQAVPVHPGDTAAQVIALLGETARDDDTDFETLAVIDDQRKLVGLLHPRALFAAAPQTPVSRLSAPPISAEVSQLAPAAARDLVRNRLSALPLVDGEQRLVGLLGAADAALVLDDSAAQDAAFAGASSPIRRPYLSTPFLQLARSRVVWLFVLAISAILTVNVLSIFEDTLAERVELALFIPLLTGVGGNTGSQAAVTVTRALAMGDAAPKDLLAVAWKELRTGLLLGLCLGATGFVVAGLAYDLRIGIVIGLTILIVCGLAATVGGVMPLAAKSIGVDPAVFSTPFIATFCDATGLLVYFTVATKVLGL